MCRVGDLEPLSPKWDVSIKSLRLMELIIGLRKHCGKGGRKSVRAGEDGEYQGNRHFRYNKAYIWILRQDQHRSKPGGWGGGWERDAGPGTRQEVDPLIHSWDRSYLQSTTTCKEKKIGFLQGSLTEYRKHTEEQALSPTADGQHKRSSVVLWEIWILFFS